MYLLISKEDDLGTQVLENLTEVFSLVLPNEHHL